MAGDFVNDNTLTVYIKRLREKIEKEPAKPEIIKTIRGWAMGYFRNPEIKKEGIIWLFELLPVK